MILRVKTLSPVHIGNGEKYNGLSYIENRGKVLFYDSAKVMENLTPQYYERFMQWIEQSTAEIEQLEIQKRNKQIEQERRDDIVQQLKKAQKKLSLNELLENTIRDISIKTRFNQNFLYVAEAQSQVYNNVNIECFLKQNNKPYIPGSEIKGAIRTAVTYKLLQQDTHWLWLRDNLVSFGAKYSNELKQIAGQKGKWVSEIKKKLVREISKIEENLQNNLFRTQRNADAKYDILKFLSIGDSEAKRPEDILFVSDVKIEGTRPLKIFQELCKKDQLLTCQGFSLENNTTIINKLGFTPEQKWVISDIKNILQCCHEFSDRLLQEEIVFLKRLNKLQIVTKLQNIQKQNTPDSPVIRIGKNEGYFSLTMGLLVKDRDKVLYDNVLCHATKNTSYTGNFPKTRRIVNVSNNEQDTLGWVKLIINE